MGGFGERPEVSDHAVGTRILHDDPEDFTAGAQLAQSLRVTDVAQVGADDVDAHGSGAGLQDRVRLWEQVFIDQQDRVFGHLAAAPHHGHRLGSGSGLVQ